MEQPELDSLPLCNSRRRASATLPKWPAPSRASPEPRAPCPSAPSSLGCQGAAPDPRLEVGAAPRHPPLEGAGGQHGTQAALAKEQAALAELQTLASVYLQSGKLSSSGCCSFPPMPPFWPPSSHPRPPPVAGCGKMRDGGMCSCMAVVQLCATHLLCPGRSRCARLRACGGELDQVLPQSNRQMGRHSPMASRVTAAGCWAWHAHACKPCTPLHRWDSRALAPSPFHPHPSTGQRRCSLSGSPSARSAVRISRWQEKSLVSPVSSIRGRSLTTSFWSSDSSLD